MSPPPQVHWTLDSATTCFRWPPKAVDVLDVPATAGTLLDSGLGDDMLPLAVAAEKCAVEDDHLHRQLKASSTRTKMKRKLLVPTYHTS